MGQQSVRRSRTRLDAGVGASCGLRSVCPGVARPGGIKRRGSVLSDTELQRADRFVTEDGKADAIQLAGSELLVKLMPDLAP